MPWQQNYDPLHGPLSTIAAALPLVLLLGLLALRRVPAYAAALAGLAAALIVAEPRTSGNVIKSIAFKRGVTIVNVNSTRMLLAFGFLRTIFEVFDHHQTC